MPINLSVLGENTLGNEYPGFTWKEHNFYLKIYIYIYATQKNRTMEFLGGNAGYQNDK
jgi:hypothetical protein